MMKFCCSIVVILCTLDVSYGGILSRKCISSNGSCGQRSYSCNATFGEGWKPYGKCCNERPCCKLAPCVSETCPMGFSFIPNQDNITNCYSFGNGSPWDYARLNCASTPGAYLWRPNTAQEAVGARNELDLMGTWSNLLIWTGANDIDQDGIFTFDIENGIFAPNAPPFGTGFAIGDPSAGPYCVAMALHEGIWTWYRRRCSGSDSTFSICEYPRRVCP